MSRFGCLLMLVCCVWISTAEENVSNHNDPKKGRINSRFFRHFEKVPQMARNTALKRNAMLDNLNYVKYPQ